MLASVDLDADYEGPENHEGVFEAGNRTLGEVVDAAQPGRAS